MNLRDLMRLSPVIPVLTVCTKTSVTVRGWVSPGTRFVASEEKATTSPLPLIAGV